MRDARLVTRALYLVAAAVAVSAAFLLTQPDLSAAERRLVEARARRNSDEVVFASRRYLERERTRLLRRHRSVVDGTGQDRFVRTLAVATRRHRVRFIGADATTGGALAQPGRDEPTSLAEIHLQLRLRGDYRRLLMTLDDIARNADSVRLEIPTLHANGSEVDATVPLIIRQADRAGSAAR